jgi:hypothetical protein
MFMLAIFGVGLFALSDSLRGDDDNNNPFAAKPERKTIEAKPSPATGEEVSKPKSVDEIRQVLARKINWDFCETPLAQVADFIGGDLKVPLYLDKNSLEEIGCTLDTPVTFKLSGVTAKVALKTMLNELRLTMFWDGEVLNITTPEVAECNLTTVLYDVSSLPALRRANGKTMPDYDQLVKILEKTIKPTSWDVVGGPGSIVEYDAGDVQVLVISQNWETHEEISDLLNRLRKIHRAPLSKEAIADLPPEPEPQPTRSMRNGVRFFGSGPAKSAPRQPEGTRGAAVPAGTPGPGVAPAGAPGAGAPAPAPGGGFGPGGYGLPPGYGMPGGGFGPGKAIPPNAAPAGAAGTGAPAPASGGKP